MAAPWEVPAPGPQAPWESGGYVSADHPLAEAAASGLNQATADIMGAPVGLMNLARHGVASLIGKFTGDDSGKQALDYLYGPEATKYTPQYFEDEFNKRGMTTTVQDPTSAAQRYIHAASGGALGGLPGVVGAVAQQGAQDMGLPPAAQAAAGLVGSLTPTAGAAALRKGLGFNSATAAENTATANAAGITKPSAGIVAGPGSTAQAAESILAKTPGSAGIMSQKISAANAAAGQTMEDIASNLGAVNDQSAGELLQRQLGGATAPGTSNYLQQIREKVNAAYQARGAVIPATTRVNVAPVLAKIDEMSAQSAEFAQWAQSNPAIQRLKAQFADGSGLPPGYTQAKVGGQTLYIDPTGKASATAPASATASKTLSFTDADNLSRDISDAADFGFKEGNTTSRTNGAIVQVGKTFNSAIDDSVANIPGAKQLSDRATAVWQEGQDAKDKLGGILRANTGEKAMNALLTGSEQGSSIVDTAMRGLSVPQQNIVAGSVIQKLGMARAGVQDAEGGVWSANTFLTNWNKLHPDVKDSLFRNMPDSYKQGLSDFAAYAANVKKSAGVYANPSGTAGVSAAQATMRGLGGAAALAATGHMKLAATTAGATILTLGGANLSARALTNPGVVRWLAASTKLPTSSLPVIAAQLARVGQQNSLPDVTALAQRLSNPQQRAAP